MFFDGLYAIYTYCLSCWYACYYSVKQSLYIFHSSKSDLCVFLVTLILTVVVDITIAVEVGVLTAVSFFVKRLIERTEIEISHISNNQPELEKHDNIKLSIT